MSKEFEKLKQQANHDARVERARHQEMYHYARSLGFSGVMARRLIGSGKKRILRLSKELQD